MKPWLKIALFVFMFGGWLLGWLNPWLYVVWLVGLVPAGYLIEVGYTGMISLNYGGLGPSVKRELPRWTRR